MIRGWSETVNLGFCKGAFWEGGSRDGQEFKKPFRCDVWQFKDEWHLLVKGCDNWNVFQASRRRPFTEEEQQLLIDLCNVRFAG